MTRKEAFSVAEFAEFSRVTRDTLLHYDKIGLLSPEVRGENKYRYYGSAQLAIVNVIRTYQALGMTLAEITKLKDSRTPAEVSASLTQQIAQIDGKITEWVQARKLLNTLQKIIATTLPLDEALLTIQFQAAEAIVLGELNDYSRGRNAYDALLSFYRYCQEKYPDLDLNYPVWGMFSAERIQTGDWTYPDRFYFYNPDGLDRKPAALYATGYDRGGYGQSAVLYQRLLDYIAANNFEICGPAYEEYPLNEICVADDQNYLIRVQIMVREISTAGK